MRKATPMTRSVLAILLASLVGCLTWAGEAQASEFEQFGIEKVAAELQSYNAGEHADFTTELSLNHYIDSGGLLQSGGRVEKVAVALPPGLVGNPTTVLQCSTGAFEAFGNCPIDSQVGVVETLVGDRPDEPFIEPLYNLAPSHKQGEVARLGFIAGLYPVFIDVSVRTASDYGVTARVEDASGLLPLIFAKTTLWSVPADPVHDSQRLTTFEALNCTTACEAPGGKRPSGLEPLPFLSNPSACQAMQLDFSVVSYQLPGQSFQATAPMEPIAGCSQVDFEPTFEAEPTSRRAGAPTGLHTVLRIPQNEDPEGTATSMMKAAKVTLPEGMEINPSAADGLAACSDAQVRLGEEVASECPNASKLGEATIVSPSLSEPLHGTVYQRTPQPGHPFRLWLVSDEFGVHIKLPAEVHADPGTGRLTAEFTDLPQLPVEEIELNVWAGDRAPLKNPDSCGSYATSYELAPWSGNSPATGQAAMKIDEGCGAAGFNPRLQAGVTSPVAGSFSPLILSLVREDGEQNVGELQVALPNGLLAKLAGVPVCGDAEAQAGNCPAASKIGSVTASVGAGPDPLWLPQPGKTPTAIYLAGPYQGAPYSVLAKVPAQAGPFDLGNVLVRSALRIDPETGQASVDTGPLPQFVEGVPALYRTLSVSIERPDFVINPTSCEEKAFQSTITSTHGAVSSPGAVFQVGGCRALGFKPKLSLKLRGGTTRGDFPALTATLRTRPGDANIRRTSVALPHSEFLAQEHIVTICTRVQFAADKCPKGSVYGYAKAWTPLLDNPLEGPVYLRSNGGARPLPDLVVALHGQVDIVLVGSIDSHNGGIRTTFAAVPDAPVSRFFLKMKGGKKGLLVNSRNICRHPGRVVVQMDAQNGRGLTFNAPLGRRCST